MGFIWIKYLHFIGVFLVVATLATEAILIKSKMTRAEIKRLAQIDGVYGLGAIIAVAGGLIMWFWVGKPAEYYTGNWIFLTKVAAFTIVGLVSIVPTVFFIKNQKGDMADIVEMPKHIRLMIFIELLILFLIPLLAVSMANGLGSF